MLRDFKTHLQAEREDVMRNVNVMIQAAAQQALSQGANSYADNPMVPSPPCAKRSYTSVGHPFDPSKHSPVDNITRVIACKLHVPIFNMSVKVAEGVARQCMEG